MSNRWIRFTLAVLAILAAAGAAYRVVDDEKRLAQIQTSSRSGAFAGEAGLNALEEFKAALHAYVAPGQGIGFWTARAGQLLDRARSSILELDATATANGAPLAEALDTTDRLAAAEQRAREHARNGQALLAGEVIFTEARDLLDGLRLEIVRGRDQVAAATAQQQAQIRQEQTYLLGGAAGILALVMLLLVPTGITPVARLEEQSDSPARALAPSAPALHAPLAPEAPQALSTAALATLCGEIAAVRSSTEIAPLLDRARALLDAKGVVVWMTSPDRHELNSVAASGYSPRVLARLGTLSAGLDNPTSEAFRENALRTTAAVGAAAGAAIAAPLPSPDGPAGVFSAELNPNVPADDARLAAARVIAAQLGALLGSIPSQPQTVPEVQQR